MRRFQNNLLEWLRAYKWVFGSLLTVCSFTFIYFFFRDQQVTWNIFERLSWVNTLGMSFVLCIPVWLTAWVNQSLLIKQGENASFRTCAEALALCQIGKYLPGNIANLIGRIGYLLKAGYRKGNVLKSILHEHLLLVISGAICSVFVLKKWEFINDFTGALLFLGGIVACVLVCIGLKRMGRLHLTLGGSLPSFLLLSLNHIILGCVLLWLLAIYDISLNEGYLYPVSVIVFSWLGGFLVPGSPGGIGVRESLILYFLSGSISPDQLFIIILIQRVLSVIADILNFVIGLGMLFLKKG